MTRIGISHTVLNDAMFMLAPGDDGVSDTRSRDVTGGPDRLATVFTSANGLLLSNSSRTFSSSYFAKFSSKVKSRPSP